MLIWVPGCVAAQSVSVTVTVGGAVRWQSTTDGIPWYDDLPNVKQDPYAVFDLNASYDVTEESVLTLSVNNILDEKYYASTGFYNAVTYGDGQPLFSTAHPLISGGTNSNRPTTGVDLNETSLENAVIQIAGWTDERGLLIAAKPKKLIVPPALMFVAERLLVTELRTATADNDINALKSKNSISGGYTVNHFLTDTNAWFLTTDVPNGAKHFVRVPLATTMDTDFDTGNQRFKARERYSFGVSDPLGLYASPGAS